MTYSSINYLILVLGTIIIYMMFPTKVRYITLLVFSVVFIWIVGGPVSVVMIYVSCSITFAVGLGLSKVKKKKLLLFLGCLLLLGTLIILKYTNYCWLTVHEILEIEPQIEKIVPPLLPIGISFYTLQLVSYLIDVYRGTVTAEKM